MSKSRNEKSAKQKHKPEPPQKIVTEKPGEQSVFFRIENIFVVLGLIFGLFFAFYTAPFQVPDENVHFYKAYQTSKLKFSSDVKDKILGDSLPIAFNAISKDFSFLSFNPNAKISKKYILERINIKPNDEYREFIYYPAANYPPTSYIPEIVAISIARMLDFGVLQMMYMSRVFALLFYVLCVFFAVRISPAFKLSLVFVALSPLHLHIAASCNGDSVINSFTFLSIGLLLAIVYSENEKNISRMLIFLIVLLISIGMQKLNYAPFALLLLLIDKRHFAFFNLSGLVCKVFFVGLICLCSLSWWYFIPLLNQSEDIYKGSSLDPYTQLRVIFTQPFNFLDVIGTTFKYYGSFYFQNYIGIFGYLDTVLPKWIYTFYTIVFAFVCFTDTNAVLKVKLRGRLLFLFVALSSIYVTMASLYLFSPVNAKIIDGVQGRYFLPLGILMALALNNLFNLKLPNWVKNFFTVLVVGCIFIILYISINILKYRYFGR
jgi:uncharacterized membrane protein